MNKTLNWIIGGLSIGVLACLIYISVGDLTTKESALLSILLTVLSVIASWLVSTFFANLSHKKAIEEVEAQHLKNLKTYALNAAEKVGNLSNELRRLSVYLQEELENDDENVEESYLSAYERIESAIHIINTLKSVNDTSLSDWRGVVGEELINEKLEEQIERENEVKELASRVEEVIKLQTNVKDHLSDFNSFEISKQIGDLKKELSLALNSVNGTMLTTKPLSKSAKDDVICDCPYCSNKLKYKQKAKANSFKTVRCSNCSKRSLARWYPDKGFILEKEMEINENIVCPWCSEKCEIKLSSIPFTKNVVTCDTCDGQISVQRTIQGINVNKIGSTPVKKTYELNEEIVQKVKALVPNQPWLTGMHREVAGKLNMDLGLVRFCIKELIKRGDFKPQIDGILYELPKDFPGSP